MKAKIALLAYVNSQLVTMKFHKSEVVPIPGASTYYARFSEKGKRVVKPLGNQLGDAVFQFRNIELAREFKNRNLPVPEGLTPAAPVSTEPTIEERVEKYLDQIDRQVANGSKAKSTYVSYRIGLTYFLEFCALHKVTLLTQLTREHMLDLQSFLRKTKKLDKSTIHTNVNTVLIFFRWADGFKVPGLQKADRPVLWHRPVEEYTDEDIALFNRHGSPEERLVIQCFLFSGLRSGELAHLTYGDIEFSHNLLHVQPKSEWNWKPKKNKSREVTIPDFLTAQLHERMKKWDRRGKDLIFFNRDRQPDGNLLRYVKRVAKRAKMSGRIDDHKFRSTAITRWLRAGYTVQDVMGFVGHEHPDTIMLYAARVNVRKPEHLAKINATWEQFAPKPTVVPARRASSGD